MNNSNRCQCCNKPLPGLNIGKRTTYLERLEDKGLGMLGGIFMRKIEAIFRASNIKTLTRGKKEQLLFKNLKIALYEHFLETADYKNHLKKYYSKKRQKEIEEHINYCMQKFKKVEIQS